MTRCETRFDPVSPRRLDGSDTQLEARAVGATCRVIVLLASPGSTVPALCVDPVSPGVADSALIAASATDVESVVNAPRDPSGHVEGAANADFGVAREARLSHPLAVAALPASEHGVDDFEIIATGRLAATARPPTGRLRVRLPVTDLTCANASAMGHR
jgi:hypothetical protein